MASPDGGSAVPGGNVAKPLIIALLALFAARHFGKGKDQPGTAGSEPAPRMPEPQPTSNPSPGNTLDGLGGLVKQFQQKGLGDTIDSWVYRRANKDISSGQMSDALGSDVVDQLSRRTGLARGGHCSIGEAASECGRQAYPGRAPADAAGDGAVDGMRPYAAAIRINEFTAGR
jgi:uncharacterized protein YidB (DUF937 family)